jgi:hypothetical protein
MAAAPANRRRAVSRVEWQSSLSVVGSWMDLVHEGRTKEEEDQFARQCDSRSFRTARLVAI